VFLSLISTGKYAKNAMRNNNELQNINVFANPCS